MVKPNNSFAISSFRRNNSMDLQQNRCTPNILPKYIALDGTLENIDPNGGTGRNIPVDASFDLTIR